MEGTLVEGVQCFVLFYQQFSRSIHPIFRYPQELFYSKEFIYLFCHRRQCVVVLEAKARQDHYLCSVVRPAGLQVLDSGIFSGAS